MVFGTSFLSTPGMLHKHTHTHSYRCITNKPTASLLAGWTAYGEAVESMAAGRAGTALGRVDCFRSLVGWQSWLMVDPRTPPSEIRDLTMVDHQP